MTTSTLDQLLAEAQAAEENSENLEQEMAEFANKRFAVSKTYQEYAQQLTMLATPLKNLLPTIAEYELYAAPHDGKVAGVNWDKERFYTKAAKQLRLKNPAYVILTRSARSKVDGSAIFSELSDDEYEDFLDTVEAMSDWWEKRPSADALELAKSVIVHTVLENDELRSMVLPKAVHVVNNLLQLNLPLKCWREEL